MLNKKFAMTGVAGFVAPKHLKAINETGNTLITALDPNDSVGILDLYFPDCRFFTETERFDRHLEKMRRKDGGIDYLSICSPNYLHDAHCRMALRVGADAICEKPLTINPWNLDQLSELEEEYDKTIYTILQLRLHNKIKSLKNKVDKSRKKKYKIILEYVTPRSNWYHVSWKGDVEKSGGVLSNIGVHFFDMLIWIFGNVIDCDIHGLSKHKSWGSLKLERASVQWLLSTDSHDLPHAEWKPYRSITIDNESLDFTDGFADLHTESYQEILNGSGFRIADAKPSIDLIYKLKSIAGTGGMSL